MTLSNREKTYLLCYDVCHLPLSAFTTLSSCSAVLAVATCYGTIHLIGYQQSIGHGDRGKAVVQANFRLPANWHAPKVLSLTTIDDSFLVASTEGLLYAWRLIDLEKLLVESDESSEGESLKSISLPPAWTLYVPSHCSGDTEEVNSIVFRQESHHLYAATGGGCVYCFDVDSGGTVLESWKAHDDSILRLCALQDSTYHIATASEDGCARVWDVRSSSSLKNKSVLSTGCSPVQEIIPASDPMTSRPSLGRWLTALCGDPNGNPDWLFCGGAPFLALWSRRALKPVTLFQPKTSEQFSRTTLGSSQNTGYEKSIATPSVEKWHAQATVCSQTVSAVGLGSMLYQWDISGRELCAEKTHLKHGMASHCFEINGESFLACVGAGKHVEIISDMPAITRSHVSIEIT